MSEPKNWLRRWLPLAAPSDSSSRLPGWLPLLTKILWGAALGCVAGGIGGWGVAQFLHIPEVDVLQTWRPSTTTNVYASDGSMVASYALERRVELKPEQISDYLKLAIVAAEDADFYTHGGVDPQSIARAAWVAFKNLVRGRDRIVTQGGSTLTQQLALNLFLQRERTLTRKAKEALLALDIEKRYSKDQILTMYANQIFLGHGAYGVEAAAKLYFDTSASDLTLAQSALMAGMIPSPNNKFDPIKRPENAVARRNRVLDRMLDLDFIDAAAHDEAVAQPLTASLHRERAGTGAYFLEMVRQDIEQKYGSDALYRQGLQVHLTMDADLQRLAENAVRDGLVALETGSLGFRDPPNVLEREPADTLEGFADPSWRGWEPQAGRLIRALVMSVDRKEAVLRIGSRPVHLALGAAKWTRASRLDRILDPGDLVMVRLPEELPEAADTALEVELEQEPEIEGALIAMDNRSGEILAMVGGFDFERSEFNRAIQSELQCGSAFKPFVYLTAFEQGYTPADTVFDAPFLLPDGTGELTYCPKNYYNEYYGIVTLRRALELSFNASAVKLQQLVGGDAVVDIAKRMGISTELHPYPSLALGSLGVRLIDLVRAYSTVANLGERPEPYFVREIYDRDNRLTERGFPRSERVVSAPVSYLLLHVLRGVIERGTGVSARSLDANLGGKTGTTDDYSDAWFIGFSPRITVGVWVGRDLKRPIGRKMTGARAAQPIWNAFMSSYLESLSDEERHEDFPVPAGVVFTPVDWYSGERAVPRCKGQETVILEGFLDGTEPTTDCSERDVTLHEVPWPFQLPFYQPRPGEPMPTPDAIAVADDRVTGRDEES
jgi:penicillin-binding protein 1A